MADQPAWMALTLAFLAVGGTITGSLIGYQQGAMSVDKDYVQIAMSNLNNKDASPELREWSVKILNKLSPVPMDPSLQKQLTVVVPPPPIPIPKSLQEPCPDIFKQDAKPDRTIEEHNAAFERLANAYFECRVKSLTWIHYINSLNKSYSEIETSEPVTPKS